MVDIADLILKIYLSLSIELNMKCTHVYTPLGTYVCSHVCTHVCSQNNFTTHSQARGSFHDFGSQQGNLLIVSIFTPYHGVCILFKCIFILCILMISTGPPVLSDIAEEEADLCFYFRGRL